MYFNEFFFLIKIQKTSVLNYQTLRNTFSKNYEFIITKQKS